MNGGNEMSDVKVIRKAGQTKFIVEGKSGLVTLHDNGDIFGSVAHKEFFVGIRKQLDDGWTASYTGLRNTTASEMKIVMDRIFGIRQ